MSRRLTTDEFKKMVYDVWGDNVEVLTPYIRNADDVLVRFKECGHEEWKHPSKLLAHHGCNNPACRYGLLSHSKTKSTEQFINDLAQKNLPYEVLSDYHGVNKLIKVKNLTCGHIYQAQPNNILGGHGCPVCHGFKDTAKFTKQLDVKYPDQYTVLGEYVNNRTPIKVKHNQCGYEWDVVPKDLLHAFRCPYCNMSLGEKLIRDYLELHDIPFIPQYRFSDCIDKKPLPFDFAIYISDQLRLIEFDGSQHYRSRDSGWNTEENRSQTNRRDQIKTDYCEQHHIPLLRIPYWKISSINKLLDSFCDIQL